MLNQKYTCDVVEICDNGDAIVQLPEELCTELDWQVGDTIKLSVESDGIILKNLNSEQRKSI